jgi:hypothetical protein
LVCQRTANQRQEQEGRNAEKGYESYLKRRARQVVEVPGNRHLLHLPADGGDELAAPDKPEVAMA